MDMEAEQESMKEQAPAEAASAPSVSEEKVWDALRTVVDPELHMDIVKLGLVYGVEIRGGDVDVEMTLTTPGCPFGPQILHAVDYGVRAVEGVTEVSINVVWNPPWGPDRLSEEAKLELGFDL
jgi:metal-sulfur cluster biosynthetic enzyme